MSVVKLKNEKKLIAFFLVVTIAVFIISAYFLYKSIQRDELGGSFITAMILFISGYGIIIFISRAFRYRFVTKLQKEIIGQTIVYISELSDKLNKSSEKIEKETTFLINNGYLSEYEIVDDVIVNVVEQERIRVEMERAEYEKRQARINNPEPEKKAQPKQKKRIESEKCPNCGAKIKFNGDDAVVCPYCGNSLKKA